MDRRIAFIGAAALIAVVSRSAAGQEVGNARVVPIQVTGDPATRFSLVVLSDGYTAPELSKFRAHVDKHLNILWSLEPFRSYRNYINVYAVEIVSGESGITCDPAHREQRSTPLSMQFGGGCTNPNARGISINQEAARSYARMATADYDQILAIANTDTYGGIGGPTATTSGGNALGPYITPHELGHSLGRLQDEYTYRARGVAGDAYNGQEPNSIHHTLLTEAQMRAQQRKWWRWLGEPSESGGVIGRYPGGQSRTSGIWRPSRHSMMISLGYYFDQVSRERMAARISSQVELISASTPVDSPVRSNEVVWIETAHPVYHELDVTWQVDGQTVPNMRNSRSVDLNALRLGSGQHTVTVKVVDPTEFVRDSAVRDTSFTATRSWTVSAEPALASPVPVAFTASTDTAHAVGGTDAVYVETTHPTSHVLNVTWRLDGRVVPNPANSRALNLAAQNLSPGAHRLSATVTDPERSGELQARSWTVDNTGPTVTHRLSEPVTSIERPDGSPHYFVRDQFTMKLDATDDQPGYVVAEFRVNGDGWHHYYGWPDAPPGSPFLFTPRGTTIKELVYGSLSAEGLSPQPWEPRVPGWGTHTIEYRARDAAGNIGATNTFKVTFVPAPACTTVVTGEHSGELTVRDGVTCVNRATVSGPINVTRGASLFVANATIKGAVTSSGAVAVELIGAAVDGTLRIGGTTGNVTLFGSTLNGDVILSDNRTAASTVLAGNRLGSTLTCDGNTMSVVDLGVPNAVRAGVAVQCPIPEAGRPE
jgi:hypothetical protein